MPLFSPGSGVYGIGIILPKMAFIMLHFTFKFVFQAYGVLRGAETALVPFPFTLKSSKRPSSSYPANLYLTLLWFALWLNSLLSFVFLQQKHP